jgi:maleylpyruvate isomerase
MASVNSTDPTFPSTKLYSYWRSSSAWRVRIALAWKGLAYEYVAVNIQPGKDEQHAVGFATVNALRQVPVLELSGGGRTLRLTQSVAIAEYLEEAHPSPPLLPADAVLRARMREMVEIVASGVQPLQNLSVTAELRRLGGDDAATAFARDAIARGLQALEDRARAHGGSYCVGDAPTLADVFLVPQLYNARRFGVDLGAVPWLLAIEARAGALPAFVAAHPDRQPDAQAPQPG